MDFSHLKINTPVMKINTPSKNKHPSDKNKHPRNFRFSNPSKNKHQKVENKIHPLRGVFIFNSLVVTGLPLIIPINRNIKTVGKMFGFCETAGWVGKKYSEELI